MTAVKAVDYLFRIDNYYYFRFLVHHIKESKQWRFKK